MSPYEQGVMFFIVVFLVGVIVLLFIILRTNVLHLKKQSDQYEEDIKSLKAADTMVVDYIHTTGAKGKIYVPTSEVLQAVCDYLNLELVQTPPAIHHVLVKAKDR